MAGGTFDRRRFLLAAGGGAAGLAAGSALGYAAGSSESDDAASGVVPFYGRNQAGIGTEAQDRIVFGSFDFTGGSKAGLESLLRDWTTAAARS